MFDGDPVIRKLSTEIERAHSRNAELLSEASELAADVRRAMAENERLRAALRAIRDGTVKGTVGGDDVVWFDGITTLYDFCDQFIGDEQERGR